MVAPVNEKKYKDKSFETLELAIVRLSAHNINNIMLQMVDYGI